MTGFNTPTAVSRPDGRGRVDRAHRTDQSKKSRVVQELFYSLLEITGVNLETTPNQLFIQVHFATREWTTPVWSDHSNVNTHLYGRNTDV
jgi:hypothetical protein